MFVSERLSLKQIIQLLESGLISEFIFVFLTVDKVEINVFFYCTYFQALNWQATANVMYTA